MYYGKGTEEGILTNLYTVINVISGIGFVDWQRIEDTGIDSTKYPGVFINSVRTDKERKLQDIVKNKLSIALVCWVWAATGENLGSKIHTFANVVRDAVAADPTRNNNARNTVIESITTDGGSRFPQGMFIMPLLITYYSEK